MIYIKNSLVLRALLEHEYHPALVDIQHYISSKYGIYITEGWREPLHPGDVHFTDPCRANDARYRFYKAGVAEKIADDVNSKWKYDPARPDMKCVIIHGKGNNKHLHIQVHQKTVKLV